jgi:YVTN family beta-propeller protein
VSVIAVGTDTVIATILLGGTGVSPFGVAVTPDGSKVFIANNSPSTVSVINAATDTVTAAIPVGNVPYAFGIFIQPPVVQSAPASGSLCNGVYDGTFHGDITVFAGQDCAFLNGGKITGNVTVLGGNFVLNGSSVGDNLTVNGGGTFTLGPAATIRGNLTIENIPPGSASNSVCGTTVIGNLTFYNNGTAVQIGSNVPLTCAGNEIGGNLSVLDDTNSVLIFANSVGVNTTVNNNTGSLDVVGNNVGNNLQCLKNSMLMMGGGNTASRKTGQCH